MSRRKGENAEVMYTADKRALQNDEIFVEFITGSHDAFVIEDCRPPAQGAHQRQRRDASLPRQSPTAWRARRGAR